MMINVAGTLAPEPWLALQKGTGIEELKITTAQEPNYENLIRRRMQVLRKHNVKLHEVLRIVDQVEPFPGAKDFLAWTKPIVPRTFMVTDTFEEYAMNIAIAL